MERRRIRLSATFLVTCLVCAGCESGNTRSAEVPVDSAVPDASFVLPEDATRATPIDRGVTDLGLPDWGDTGGTGAELPDSLSHRRDDELSFAHLQALGTHNSYHLEPELPIPAWQYSHLPLDQQLGEQGVRQFELDVYYDREQRIFEVYHIFALDQETTCATLPVCLDALKSWSDEHRSHHPILVLMEIKGANPPESLLPLLRDLETQILSVWPWERLVHPDLLRRGATNLRDAIQEQGWPSLGVLRGRALFVLHTSGQLRDLYTRNLSTTAGRVLFPDAYGDLELPIAAYHSINGPIGGFERIQRTVRAGHLVRTRADADVEQAQALDYRQFEAALESGAHFISTDFPFPGDETRYGVTIPGGLPSRCNPLTAPMDCLSEDIEDPAIVRP